MFYKSKFALLSLFSVMGLIISPLSGCYFALNKIDDESQAQADKAWFMDRSKEEVISALLPSLQKDVALIDVQRKGDFIVGKTEATGINWSIEFVVNKTHTTAIVRVDMGMGTSSPDYQLRSNLKAWVHRAARIMNREKGHSN